MYLVFGEKWVNLSENDLQHNANKYKHEQF